jgi:hypothetical protein
MGHSPKLNGWLRTRKRPLAAVAKLLKGRYPPHMKLRTRKAIGIFSTILFMIVYALVVMALGGRYIVGYGIVVELPFYILGGLGWLPGAMVIIRWMSKPD